eukprot:4991480-Pyramimonas_sp.AAC.1
MASGLSESPPQAGALLGETTRVAALSQHLGWWVASLGDLNHALAQLRGMALRIPPTGNARGGESCRVFS